MKIELYLKNINQEMIDAGRTPLNKGLTFEGETSWVVSWPKSCCVLDFALPDPHMREINLTRGFIMRAEREGG